MVGSSRNTGVLFESNFNTYPCPSNKEGGWNKRRLQNSNKHTFLLALLYFLINKLFKTNKRGCLFIANVRNNKTKLYKHWNFKNIL